jgi:hypothetical protein
MPMVFRVISGPGSQYQGTSTFLSILGGTSARV